MAKITWQLYFFLIHVCAPLYEPSNISNLDFSITVRQERLRLSYAPIEIAESVKNPITIELRSGVFKKFHRMNAF